ncbi:MAG: hypothetical protein DRJ63_06665 [Thermoprotei archaeon]|nr:MAG: hypothetical protein DRJ63_06665 [Thermoprotei archaeon]
MVVIRVSESTKKELIRFIARLEAKLGRRVSMDEAIRFLLFSRVKRPELLEIACSPINGENLVEELYEERRKDEERVKRKYGL